ncbi:MAG: zeta toxin family protein [Cycloclasticus sp.]|nr:zeta toxin family protein [Cycloclasticus sp.]
MELDPTKENLLLSEALQFARKNKKRIAKELTDIRLYPPEEGPVSVFMAGSPGAGKTETSIQLIKNASASTSENLKVLRIDADELRTRFEGYDGCNSSLFQAPVSILVEKIHDFALKNSQSFVLDGTLSNYEIAKSNIERSLNKGRVILIIYVYQDPKQAWAFVKAREKIEGRKVTLDTFITQYFTARHVVNKIKKVFKKSVKVDLLLKNIDGSDNFYKANIDQVDIYIPEIYTKQALEEMLSID